MKSKAVKPGTPAKRQRHSAQFKKQQASESGLEFKHRPLAPVG